MLMQDVYLFLCATRKKTKHNKTNGHEKFKNKSLNIFEMQCFICSVFRLFNFNSEAKTLIIPKIAINHWLWFTFQPFVDVCCQDVYFKQDFEDQKRKNDDTCNLSHPHSFYYKPFWCYEHSRSWNEVEKAGNVWCLVNWQSSNQNDKHNFHWVSSIHC